MLPLNTPGGASASTASSGVLPTPSGIGGPGLGRMASRRCTVSLSDLRTPLVENLMAMLPMGSDKAFKYALYNVVALILASVCIIAFWATYCILEPFIVPLLWALLCGSVIHPFKDRLVSFTKEWLVMVKSSSTPLAAQVMFIPLLAVDSVSESIGNRVATWWKYIAVGCGGFFLTYLIYHNPPVTLGLILYWICVFVVKVLFWMISWINGPVVIAVTVVYGATIVHYIYGFGVIPEIRMQEQIHQTEELEKPENKGIGKTHQPKTSERKKDEPNKIQKLENEKSLDKATPTREQLIVRTLSVTAWIIWFVYICRLLPYPLLLFVVISLGTGTVAFLRKYSLRRSQMYSPYTILAILTGSKSTQNSRGVSRKGSLLQVKTRRSTQMMKTPTTPPPPMASNTGTPFQQHRNNSISEDEPYSLPASFSGFNTPYAVKKVVPNLDLKSQEQHEDPNDESLSIIEYCVSDDALPPHSEFSEDEVDGLLDSNKFLYGVFSACLVVHVWNRMWLIHLLPIPVIYFGLKKMCLSLGLKDYLEKQVYEPFQKFYVCSGPNSPSRDLFPQPVRHFLNIMYESDKKIISAFESYLDMIATIVILVAVMVVSVIFLIFVATQFYAEGDHLVRVGANVINSTVSKYPEISQLLPEGWESLTDSLIGNAYHYGRDYIKTMIRDSVAEKNPAKAEEMERQVIELWDRIYISWNRTWGNLDSVGTHGKGSGKGVGLEWNDFVKTGQNVTDWFDTSMVVSYAKSNYGQLRAVLESVWTVFIGNVSLAISALTSVFSVLFGGGSALLNLIISFVVFFTALFYLLSSSTSVYKPVELFTSLMPGDGIHSSNFVAAIEESVSGVFSATLKMSAFYGMWTWLIHTLFQVNIVFVPSFFAAIFAAVPLLMPYWAVFPAVLELWLIQGQWTKALLMLLAQMAPMSLVDAQIYSEIKGGGHPYLTALAVAGGIFYFGFQGAIMGPVVLCSLFVAAKMGSTYMKEGVYS